MNTALLLMTGKSISILPQWHYYIALAIFFITFAFITTERVNRTIIALLGAGLMVFIGIIEISDAYKNYIDWETITLLIGMMTIVSISLESGVFNYLAVKAGKLTNGHPVKLLLMFCIITAIGSAFLDNVTTVLLLVPITITLSKMLKVNPMPFLIAEIFFANIGGAATQIGDPTNIMIGSANPHLTFLDFILHLAPLILIVSVFVFIFLLVVFRKDLKPNLRSKLNIQLIDESKYIKNPRKARESIIVLIATLLLLFAHNLIGISASVIAMGGATVLLLLTKNNSRKIEHAFAKLEWSTIIFLIALFIQIGGLIEVGVIDTLANILERLVGSSLEKGSFLVLWSTGLFSGISGNMTATTVMIPVINEWMSIVNIANIKETSVIWWSLSFGACLGATATLFGSSANIVVASMARKEGYKISYVKYLLFGLPVTLISLTSVTLYIYIRYFLIGF